MSRRLQLSTLEPEYEAGVVDRHCGARPFTAAAASRVLDAVLQHCTGRTVLFDLDSTLLDNRPRNALIMREFAKARQLSVLSAAEPQHWQDWSVRRTMANIGLPASLIDQHIEQYEQFWFERFFTSEYCVHDAPTPGAVRFVERVQANGGRVLYLTGRSEQMRHGTLENLTQLGFAMPDDDSVALNMKPRAEDSDDQFKRDCARALRASGAIAAAFDNEPQHINTYHELLGDAICVHLYTDHSMREIPLHSGIASIRSFVL